MILLWHHIHQLISLKYVRIYMYKEIIFNQSVRQEILKRIIIYLSILLTEFLFSEIPKSFETRRLNFFMSIEN